MTAEDLNQKHPEYEAWSLNLRGNMEKIIIFKPIRFMRYTFLYCTLIITSFL